MTISPSASRPVAALTGFAAITLEMAWARQLANILGGSTYTFTSTLTVVLLGIALGGILYVFIERFVRSKELIMAVCSATIFLICFVIVLTQLFIPQLCLLSGALKDFRESEFCNGLICAGAASVLELLPAVGMGLLFPALVMLARGSNGGAGSAVGSLYLWNTIGAALGAVLASSVFVPWIGLPATIAVAICAYLIGSILLAAEANSSNVLRACLITAFGVIVSLLLIRTYSPLDSNMGMYIYGPTKDPSSV